MPESRKQSYALVVVLKTDELVKTNKGDDRPIDRNAVLPWDDMGKTRAAGDSALFNGMGDRIWDFGKAYLEKLELA